MLIFIFDVYNAREKHHVNILQLKSVINRIKDAERKINENENRTREKYCEMGVFFIDIAK